MNKINSYPKVLALGHRYIENIFDGEYVVEEKIDGSQISFGVFDDVLTVRSKNTQLELDCPPKMFENAIESLQGIKSKLESNVIYRGEYLQKPKHNALTYDRVPINHIIIFDIELSPGYCVDYHEKILMSQKIGLEVVPSCNVNVKNANDIIDYINHTRSYLGGTMMEGVVVKNYRRITPDGKFMAGKFVSELFKERNNKNWKNDNPSRQDLIKKIIDTLKTEARYRKAVFALRDMNKLNDDPSDIGQLMRLIHKDIDEEEREFIKTELYKHFISDVKRGVCGGLPQWYKNYLLTKGE